MPAFAARTTITRVTGGEIMRRFELEDGTSSKFWQVLAQGDTLRVQFGKIGSNGQIQLKKLSSDAAVEAEMDKLIKEKLKKGYSEVAVAGGAAPVAPAAPATTPAPKPAPKASPSKTAPVAVAPPAPAPSPPVAPPPAKTKSVAGSVVLSDAAKREAAPNRGSSTVPARLPDAKTSYAVLAKAMKGLAAMLDKGTADITQTAAERALTVAARAAFSTDTMPDALDVDAQAAAYALIGPPSAWGDDSRTGTFVLYWLAKGGASFALEALAAAATLRTGGPEGTIALTNDPKYAVSWWRSRDGIPWRPFRVAAVLADGAEHARLLEVAERIARAAGPQVRAALAAALERTDWSTADLAAHGAQSWIWPVVLAAPNAEAAKALMDTMLPANSWQRAGLVADFRYDLVARYGLDAAPILKEALAQSSIGQDRLRQIAQALAMLVTDDVAGYFVKQLATKDLREVAVAFLQTHSEVAIAPLAVAASGKGVGAEAAKSVLKALVASVPDEVAAVKPTLPSAAQHALDHLAEQLQTKPDADAEELPPVLRTPPWTQKLENAAPVVLALEPLPYPDAMQWKPGEEPRKDKRAVGTSAEVAALLAKVRATSKSTPAPTERSYNMTNARILIELPKKDLLEVVPELDLGRFSWSYYAVAEALVEQHGVDVIDFVIRTATVDGPTAVIALRRASSARVAPLMADAFVRLKRVKETTIEWLLAFPEAAAYGLIPPALGKPGKARDAAEAALRLISVRGQRTTIEAVAAKYGAAASDGIRATLDFDPLRMFPAKIVKDRKMPAFWSAGAFTRPLLVGGKSALPLDAVEALGTMLSFTELETPYPGIAQVKAACDPRSLAEFAWDLFQAWLMAGGSSKDQWAFLTLAHLGDDDTARRLTPLVRAWPGEAAHARAVLGLEVLARIGTDVALMHLHGIAQKLKFKGLQEKAREKIDQIAEARGLTAEELADRLVPDLGLDDGGSLSLDFGARQFRVTFDETLKPLVLDDTGKRVPDLPKPKQSDDAEKAKEATELWKTLKKDARVIATSQLARLETAMCGERRWGADVFRTFLLEHPLLIHVVRRLVWGTYDPKTRQLTGAFRAAEDSTLANVKDDAFELPEDGSVGIVHRFDLDDAQAGAWGQILSDYEVIQPFAQLSREVTRATDEQKKAKKLDQWKGLKLPTGKVLGLDSRGWRRGAPQDAGVVCWYEKPLAGGFVACLDLSGIYTGMIAESPEQELGDLTLHRGTPGWSTTGDVEFGEVSAIGFSELLRDLDSLRS